MLVVCFEGGDAVGKATQSIKLTDTLNNSGLRAKRVEIPYNDGFTYKIIYKLVKSPHIDKFPTFFQIVQILNKLSFQIKNWTKISKEYDVLVLDRWKMSTEVYGIVTNAKSLTWKISNRILKNPDITIILRGNSYNKKCLDEYEKNMKLQKTVKEEYFFKYAREHVFGKGKNGVVELLNVSGKTIDQIHDEIVKLIYCYWR